jgi:hypothetical protein
MNQTNKISGIKETDQNVKCLPREMYNYLMGPALPAL